MYVEFWSGNLLECVHLEDMVRWEDNIQVHLRLSDFADES